MHPRDIRRADSGSEEIPLGTPVPPFNRCNDLIDDAGRSAVRDTESLFAPYVVGDHRRYRDIDESQEKRREDACPVLAPNAVNENPSGLRFGDRSERQAELISASNQCFGVQDAVLLRGVCARQPHPEVGTIGGVGVELVEERHRRNLQAGRHRRISLALPLRLQVDDRANAVRARSVPTLRSEPSNVVSANQRPHRGAGTVRRSDPAEISDVDAVGPVEILRHRVKECQRA